MPHSRELQTKEQRGCLDPETSKANKQAHIHCISGLKDQDRGRYLQPLRSNDLQLPGQSRRTPVHIILNVSNTPIPKLVINGAEMDTVHINLVCSVPDIDADFETLTRQPGGEGHVTDSLPAIPRGLGLNLDERKLANDVDADYSVEIVVVHFLAVVVIANKCDSISVAPQGSREIEYGGFNGDEVSGCDCLGELQGLSQGQGRAVRRLATSRILG